MYNMIMCDHVVTVFRYLEKELPTPQVFCQNVKHPYHLGEDEDSVTSLLQTHKQFVQKNQLSTTADQLL